MIFSFNITGRRAPGARIGAPGGPDWCPGRPDWCPGRPGFVPRRRSLLRDGDCGLGSWLSGVEVCCATAIAVWEVGCAA